MNMIAAVDSNWAIGNKNKLLISIPADMKMFRQETTGKVVVMGRKTLESLPGGKPLPKRTNIVLTRDENFQKDGCIILHSIEELLEKYGQEDLMVMGGAEIYTKLLPYCDTCYITEIDREFEADKHIPNVSADPAFEKVWESEEQVENGISYRFVEYKRV